MPSKNWEEIGLNSKEISEIMQLYHEFDFNIRTIARQNPEKLTIDLIELFYEQLSTKRDKILYNNLINCIKNSVDDI
jgi:hypothetical protein